MSSSADGRRTVRKAKDGTPMNAYARQAHPDGVPSGLGTGHVVFVWHAFFFLSYIYKISSDVEKIIIIGLQQQT